MHSNLDINNNADRSINITAGPSYILKADLVEINGPPPGETSKAAVQAQTVNTNVTESIGSRVPEHHPWKGVSIREKMETGKGNSG